MSVQVNVSIYWIYLYKMFSIQFWHQCFCLLLMTCLYLWMNICVYINWQKMCFQGTHCLVMTKSQKYLHLLWAATLDWWGEKSAVTERWNMQWIVQIRIRIGHICTDVSPWRHLWCCSHLYTWKLWRNKACEGSLIPVWFDGMFTCLKTLWNKWAVLFAEKSLEL